MSTELERTADPYSQALTRLVGALAEDAIFAFTGTPRNPREALDGLSKRRADAYTAVLQGVRVLRMETDFDHWMVEMMRAMAPVAPPSWMPMHEVIAEKVTLEVGARGLRSLFSSKPSDKDVQRVKRLGSLAVRTLRAVFAADGPIDADEARSLAGLIGSLGLPDSDSAPMYTEAPISVEQLDMYGELEPGVARALIAGAWYGAASDALDPREEQVVRTLAKKISFPADDLERLRADALARVDARRNTGLATVDAVRYILHDRVPGSGVQLAAKSGTLMLPSRYREEALAQVGHGAPVTLAKRYTNLGSDERAAVLGIAWAAGLHEDPTFGRRALLRARHDRLAADLGDDGSRIRASIDEWYAEVLAPVAFNMK